MRDRGGPGGPWIWMALLGVGVVALVVVLVGLVGGDGDASGDGTTVVLESGDREAAETETVAVEAATTGEPTSVVVPDVVGMRLAVAGSRAEDANLIADSYPVEADAEAGLVVAQDPAPGTEVAPTRRLRLDVSVGPGPRETLRVPDVTGPTAPRARQIAWERGFTTVTADRDAPTAEEVDEVILQEPAAGGSAPAFTQITLYVGR